MTAGSDGLTKALEASAVLTCKQEQLKLERIDLITCQIKSRYIRLVGDLERVEICCVASGLHNQLSDRFSMLLI